MTSTAGRMKFAALVFLATMSACVDFENYEIERVNVNYSQVYEFTINSEKEYILVYPNSNLVYPHRVSVWSFSATKNFPAMVVLRQERSILSWQVPLEVDSQSGSVAYKNTSRTLCHNNMDVINTLGIAEIQSVRSSNLISQTLLISLSTSDVNDVTVNVLTTEETDFFVEKNHNYTFTVSPSQPRYVYYRFTDEDTDSMLVYVDSTDDICLTVSIQESECPVLDLNRDIKYRGKFATIDRTGGIPVLKTEFPNGFFLVFSANADNFECSQENSIIPSPRGFRTLRPQNRTSVVSFEVRDRLSKSDYFTASLVALGSLAGFVLLFVVLTCLFFRWGRLASLLSNKDTDEVDGDDSAREGTDVEKYITTESLVVTELCTKPNKNNRRSFNYLWHTNSIALFYSIPVVQLVITYQRVVNVSGNLDMCYYNFLCAHPAWGLSDFNHVYSNIGYILIGMTYMMIILYRQASVNPLKGHGIPTHYGFFYAMGVALIIEGILSACYHICPSQSSYQFDLSFMYIMAILIMVKLYHNRHPDVNASAYATFTVIGIGIFAAMIGILNGSLFIWILFIVFYVWFCIYLSLKIYFFSYVMKGVNKFKSDVVTYGFCKLTFAPVKKGRFIILLIANVFNYAIIIVGVLQYLTGATDFGTFLLATLLANSVLHSLFYISMKLVHKEQICAEAAIFGVIALLFWAASGYFFFNSSTQWTLTPAQSRGMNQSCMILNFYDSHDIWHMLSAGAMFLTFMFLLTLDDDLALTPRELIPVF